MSVPWSSWVRCGPPFDAPGPLELDLEGDFEMAASLQRSADVGPEPLRIDKVQNKVQNGATSIC